MASAVVSDNFETSTGAIPQLGGADVTTRLSSAWVNFNGTGTVAIRASYNVSSITDNGTGDYTVNFTTAMSDANYVVSGQGSIIGTDGRWQFEYQNARTTSIYRFLTANTSQVLSDSTYACIAIFR